MSFESVCVNMNHKVCIHKHTQIYFGNVFVQIYIRPRQVYPSFPGLPDLALTLVVIFFFFLNHHLGRFHKNFPRTKLVHNTQKLQRHRKRHPCESTPIYAAISFFSCSPVFALVSSHPHITAKHTQPKDRAAKLRFVLVWTKETIQNKMVEMIHNTSIC